MQGGNQQERVTQGGDQGGQAPMYLDQPEQVSYPRDAVGNLIIHGLEEVYGNASNGGIWSKYSILAYTSLEQMQQRQQNQWSHTYGPVKSDNNNKQYRYAFNTAGIALDGTIRTKVYRAVSSYLQEQKLSPQVMQEKIDLITATLKALSKDKTERTAAVEQLKGVLFRDREGYLQTLIQALGGSLDPNVASLNVGEKITIYEGNAGINLVDILKAFWRSACDSEVALLSDLYDCFTLDNNFLQFIEEAKRLQKLPYLHVIVTSNMGPCIRCQARIEALLQDLQAYAQRWQCQIWLRLDTYYTTKYNTVNREAYGYDPVRYQVAEHMVRAQQPEDEDWSYWSVSFKHLLG